MLILVTVLTVILSAGLIFGGLHLLQKQVAGSVGAARDALIVQIEEAGTKLKDLMKYSGSFASKGQLESVVQQIDQTRGDLSTQKDSLKSIETKLDSAQKSVEDKEAVQQELKSAKEEDEIRLKELLDKYQNISSESISLEQKLASSLKNLDTILDEIEMTQDQRAVLAELQSTLTNGGSRLRDLLMECDTVNERLKALETQHTELEEEYTKLVEQQLGE